MAEAEDKGKAESGAAVPGKSGAAAATETAGEAQNKLGLVEKMGCACLNVSCLLILILVISFFILVVSIIINPGLALWEAIKAFANLIASYFK